MDEERGLRRETFGGHSVQMFRETGTGPMPDLPQWTAIKSSPAAQERIIPGIGSVKFVVYRFQGERRFAVVAVVDSAVKLEYFDDRFIIEDFERESAASSAYQLAVARLQRIAGDLGVSDEAREVGTERAEGD